MKVALASSLLVLVFLCGSVSVHAASDADPSPIAPQRYDELDELPTAVFSATNGQDPKENPVTAPRPAVATKDASKVPAPIEKKTGVAQTQPALKKPVSVTAKAPARAKASRVPASRGAKPAPRKGTKVLPGPKSAVFKPVHSTRSPASAGPDPKPQAPAPTSKSKAPPKTPPRSLPKKVDDKPDFKPI